MLIKPQTTFKERLSEALNFMGCSDFDEQIKKVSEAAGVTAKTAKKYFTLDACPMNKYPIRLLNLSEALNCSHSWLYDGDGLSPYDEAIAKSMALMTEYEKRKMVRMAIRMVNNDPKVEQAKKLFYGGFINRAQFFAMM
jgi:hypothetical protein